MAKTDAARDDSAGANPALAGDPLLSARPHADDKSDDRLEIDPTDGELASGDSTKPANAPGSAPTESSRSVMFSVLVVVMASAPTYVALRAIRASRSADFPLGESLGNAAVVLFAVFAIGLLSVCFWPSMSTATWGAPSAGTMLGASGVVMACIGSTHAVAGIIGTGFLSEPAWLGWLVLIGVYPLAGYIAHRLALDYVGGSSGTKTSTKRPTKKPSKRSAAGAAADVDVDADTTETEIADGGYVRERSFGIEGPDPDSNTSPDASPRRDSTPAPLDRDRPGPPEAPEVLDLADEYDPTWHDEPTRSAEISSRAARSDRGATSPAAAPVSTFNTAEAYDTAGDYEHDPFADTTDEARLDAAAGDEGLADDDWDDDDEWDDDSEDWDDDPFADYDD